MRIKKFIALALGCAVLAGAGAAFADGYTVDNDTFASGNQNIVSVSATPGQSVSAAAQIVVSYSGGQNSKHLTPNQTLTFTGSSSQSTLPAGATIPSISVNIPGTWGSNSSAAGSGTVTFTAPNAPGSYSYSAKWNEPSNPSCTAGNGQCLTGAAALVINLTVEAPANTAPTLSLSNVGLVEGNTLGGATVSFSNSASDTEDGDLTSAIVCDADESDVFPVGTTTVNCSVTDSGDLTTTGSFTVEVVDTTPPALSLPANITTGPTNAFGATASWAAPTATDIVDGTVAVTCSKASGSQFGFGTSTVSCSATDAANNTGTGSFTVTVTGFVFNGFYSPVNMTLTNTVKGGSTVPVKWRLFGEGNAQITDIAAVTSIKSVEYACSTGDIIANSEVSATATGGTSLRYDTTEGQFIYNWKTPNTKNKCYTLTVSFTDGSSKSANFMTK